MYDKKRLMSKKNLLCIYYFLWRGFLYFFTTFILKNFSFLQCIIEYRRYFLIVTLSLLYYYLIFDDEDKKFQKTLIINANLYLFIFLFFRPLLHIEIVPFLILSVILFVIRKTKSLSKKIKLPIIIVWWFISLVILLSGLFYLYPEEPDFQWFIQTKENTLFLYSQNSLHKRQATVEIKNLNNGKVDQLSFKEWEKKITIKENTQITYQTNQNNQENQIFILFDNGEVIQLLPQSSMVWTNTGIMMIQWESKYHPSLIGTPKEKIWLFSVLDDETYEDLIETYQKDLENYLYKQIGSHIQQNKEIRNINKKFLTILDTLFPKIFSKNVKNAEMFERYFENTSSIIDTTKYQTSKYKDQNSELLNSAINLVEWEKHKLKIF